MSHDAMRVALALARGTYQVGLIDGDEALSGARLRGRAKDYIMRYRASGEALVSRLESYGVGRETRGDHNRRDIEIAWQRATTYDDVTAAPSTEAREILMERYGGQRKYDDETWVRAHTTGRSPTIRSRSQRWSYDQEHEGRQTEPCWTYRGRDLRPVAYLPYGDERDLRRFEREGNATLRSMIWQECGMRLAPALPAVHSDDYGTLRRTLDGHLIVQVLNSTAEPDGTYRDYFLRVPPDMRTAHEAVAWTFGLTPAEYELSAQS